MLIKSWSEFFFGCFFFFDIFLLLKLKISIKHFEFQLIDKIETKETMFKFYLLTACLICQHCFGYIERRTFRERSNIFCRKFTYKVKKKQQQQNEHWIIN